MKIILPIIKPLVEMEENATLYFERPTGTFTTNPLTLNEEPVYEEYIVKAHLTQLLLKVSENELAGLDQNSRPVKGFLLVESLPSGLRSSDRVKTVMSSSGISEEGILFFNEVLTSMRDNIVKTIGIPIEGYFQVIGGGS